MTTITLTARKLDGSKSGSDNGFSLSIGQAKPNPELGSLTFSEDYTHNHYFRTPEQLFDELAKCQTGGALDTAAIQTALDVSGKFVIQISEQDALRMGFRP